MRVTPEEFGTLRAWTALFIETAMPFARTLPPEAHPIAVLDAMAGKSPSRARKGLAMTIGDLVEGVSRLPPQEVARLDALFRDAGLPTLSAMRLRFSNAVARIVRRGSIKSDEEYYLIRNAADDADAAGGPLWAMLADYEQRVAGAGNVQR